MVGATADGSTHVLNQEEGGKISSAEGLVMSSAGSRMMAGGGKVTPSGGKKEMVYWRN